MSEQIDLRFTLDIVKTVVDPLREKMDSNINVLQKLTDNIVEINRNVELLRDVNQLIDTHSDEFRSWKNKLMGIIGIAIFLLTILSGSLVEFYFNIKQLNSMLEPISTFIKNFKP